MRISDWSSDVCSSDLLGERLQILFKQRGQLQQQIAALIAGQRTPRRTGRTRRLHGGVDILWRSQRDLAGDLRGRRIDMRMPVAAAAFKQMIANAARPPRQPGALRCWESHTANSTTARVPVRNSVLGGRRVP